MSKVWNTGNGRRRRPKYGEGTAMTRLLDIINNPLLSQEDATEAVLDEYPHLRGGGETLASQLIYDTRRRSLGSARDGMVHDFIVEHGRPPEPPDPPRRGSWWRRLLGRIFLAVGI